MNTKTKKTAILVTIAVLALGAVATVVYYQRRPKPHPAVVDNVPRRLPPAVPTPDAATAGSGGHATSIDKSYSSVLAMYRAPEGATPCESAYNAAVAEQQAASTSGQRSIFAFVAKQDVFLKLCRALPADSQQCLVPRYQARNQQACDLAKPPADKLDKLFVIRKDLDQPEEPVQPIGE